MREEESSLTTEAKLDPLIAPYVKLLNIHSINTEWSCQGHLHEKYPTGFPKPKTARISGFLRHLSDLLKIEELLVGEGCHCGTCKHFRITACVRADATGIHKPIQYYFSIEFDYRITKGYLKKAAETNKLLRNEVNSLGLEDLKTGDMVTQWTLR